MIRVVFDTNTYISAMLHPTRVPNLAIKKAIYKHQILISDVALGELRSVIQRPKFDRYTSPKDRAAFVQILLDVVVFVEPTETIVICRDPKDDKFLELAVAGQANYLITGDDDLIALNPFRTVQIVSPAMFLELDNN